MSTPTKACPHCGAQVAQAAVMCPQCKADLGLGKGWLAKNRSLVIALSVIGFIAVFGLIGLIGSAADKNTEGPDSEAAVELSSTANTTQQTASASQPPKTITPQENIAQSTKVVLKDRFRSAEIDTPGEAIIQFSSDENAWDTRKDVCKDSVKTAKQIYANEGSVKNLIFLPFGNTIDVYGNESDRNIMVIHISRATSDKINPEGIDYDKCKQFVDFYIEKIKFD